MHSPCVKAILSVKFMSKAQLIAFLAMAETDPSLKQKVEAATDPSAVTAIARDAGFTFSPASLSRHLRG